MSDNSRRKRIVQQPAAQIEICNADNEPSTRTKLIRSKEYSKFLHSIKDRVRRTQQKAILGINRELILLYWDIGRMILRKQKKEGWGSKVIEILSNDLCHEFPDIKGFSVRHLKYMQNFAKQYSNFAFVQQAVAQLPWGHICTLLYKVQDRKEREWYIRECLAYGWSRNVLIHQIDSGLFHRRGKAVTNFQQTLPDTSSDLAHQTIKDPYIFDFLNSGKESKERDLERALIDNIRDFLLELGLGFSFVGSQYPIVVGGDEFYIDLLFYHLKLRCFVVVDLKAGGFQPEHAGKMNFYLAAVDRILKHPTDGPSIGLIISNSRNKLVAEYSMSDMNKPMGVTTYRLPKNLLSELPSPELFERRFRKYRKKKA